MAQKSGFFNALHVDGDYDRKYNANDYSDNLAVVISNGVLRSTGDDLKVTANGLLLTVAAGRAWINGHYYYNDAVYALPAVVVPVGGSRWDRVVLRLNTNVAGRSIELAYLQGTASMSPERPAITREGGIYDLVLADIYSTSGGTGLIVADKRADADLCGWVYSVSGDNSFLTSLDNSFYEWFANARDTLSSVTLFKRYTQTATLTGSTTQLAILIPQYDPETCFAEVYVNGIFDTRHTIANYIVTFEGTLVAGTVVTINVYKSIDGTGIMDVADEITELQNKVAALEAEAHYSYKCTGLNDNISLSEIAQALLSRQYVAADVSEAAAAFLEQIGGNAYLQTLTDNSQVTVEVVGTLGATTPFGGSGTEQSRYRWFAFGGSGSDNKRIIFDFAKCDAININCAASTNNIIFYGTDLNIKNATVFATNVGANCVIDMVAGSNNNGTITVEGCKLTVQTSGRARIAENGTFINCVCKVFSSANHAFCFSPRGTGLVQLIGGTYYAYAQASSYNAAIIYTYSTDPDAVVMAYNINCPTSNISGWFQQYVACAYGGKVYISGLISTQDSMGTYKEIVGQIWKSKVR